MLRIRNLQKTYGRGRDAKLAIRDVTLDIGEGEFVSLLGPSGCGKTTLLKCISGLVPASGGTVELAGHGAGAQPRLGVVFQDYSRSLYPWLSVRSNVEFPLRGKGLSRRELRARADEALAAVGLAGVERSHPWQLSGGMQQRVAIARALSFKPEVLLMDEPFAAVDAQTRNELEDLLLAVWEELQIMTLFVTHDIDEAVYLSDRVFVLSGSPAEVIAERRIELPRRRDQVSTKADPRFGEIRAELYQSLANGTNTREKELILR